VGLLLVLLLDCFTAVGFYLMAALLPAYMVEYAGQPAHIAITIHTINMVVFAGTMVLGGFLADKYGRTMLLVGSCVASVLLAYPVWLLFSLQMAGVVWFAQCVLVAAIGIYQGSVASALPAIFPKGVSPVSGSAAISSMCSISQTTEQCEQWHLVFAHVHSSRQ
jgi:MFS transporter, MHS family, proline/betaine transporter